MKMDGDGDGDGLPCEQQRRGGDELESDPN
jgi:hypothetical protein